MKNTVLAQPVLSLKTAVILDVSNLYFTVQKKYGYGSKIDFDAYLLVLEKAGHVILDKTAFYSQPPSQFTEMLRFQGFEVFADIQYPLVPMALRAADIIDNVDCVVFGSTHNLTTQIFTWVKHKGKIPKCFAPNIPQAFKRYAECIELEDNVLYEATETTK